MTALPLTHHDIVALVLPFSADGWRVDLAASDRSARRLVFRPTADDPAPASFGEPRTELQAECSVDGSFTLTRRQQGADGLWAELLARGRDAAALLAAMAAVPAARHFAAGPGWVLARSFRLQDIRPGGHASVQFARGQARLDGLALAITVPGPSMRAAEIVITPDGGRPRPALPEDLLAVLGWPWARLVADRAGWTSRMRLPRGQARRHAGAEAALDLAAAHLARTLSEGPAQWHPRHRAARWGVFFRRGIPTFNVTLLLGSLLVATQLDIHVDRAPGLWVALYHVPTALIALSFMLQELPCFEIPPLPRRLRALRWWEEGGDAATAAAEPGVP